MTVHYSRPFAILLLILGAMQLVLNLITGNLFGLIPGGVCTLIGFLYLTKPYFFIEGNVLVMPALIGPMKKRYPFEEGALQAKGNALYNGEKKLGARRWLANHGEWDALVTQLKSTTAFD